VVGCQPFNANIKNTSTNSVNYNWLFGEGNSSGLPDSSFSFTFDTAGVFNIKLYSFNALGCVDSIQKSITVHPKPFSDFTIDPKMACAYPVKVQTTNKSKGFVSSDWNFGNTRISTLDNPFVFYDSVGTYTLALIVTSDKGCKDTSNAEFKALQIPYPSFTGTPVSGCEPMLVSFQNKTLYASEYLWDFGDGTTPSKLERPVHVYKKEGIYTVKLTATGSGVCTDSLERKNYMQVLKQPDVAFSYLNNNNPVPHGEVQFTNLTLDAISYHWDFGDGDTSNVMSPTHKYDTYGNVQVKLIAKNLLGCSDTATTLILVDFYKGLWVPTALTPDNGSPETRLFFPKGRGLAKYSLQIYDNWGILVWKSDKLENGSPVEGWDGIGQNGQAMPPDVYVWKVYAEFEDGTLWQGQNLGGGKKTQTVGTVTLLR
jgi:large repetitive protein